MNNKDLFNAINDIDEKFIEDAGKYLNDDDSDDPLHPKAVEIFPGEARFPVIKLVASIAASAVFITGVTFAVKHYRDKFDISPNAASDAGETGEQDPEPELGTHAVKTEAGPLPFELIGPDGNQIWYKDLNGFVTREYTLDDSNAPDVELTEDNWISVVCNFAYYALPSGNNYNSIDNSDLEELGEPDLIMGRDFKRIYEGNVIGDLTVTKASCQLTRGTYTDPDTEETREVTYLSNNVIEFDGETTAEVYIVNDNDNYACVFRNGADNFPIVGYDMGEYLKSDSYFSKINTLECKNGFKYYGDMPVMWLDDEEKAFVEPFLSNANYLRAMVTFKNVTLVGTQDFSSTPFDINADISRVVFSGVDTVVTDNNLFGESPFTAETETQLRSILGSASDIWELKTNEEVMSLTGCDDIRVYKGIDSYGNLGEELYSGTLVSGNRSNSNIIVLYDNGEPLAAYDYFTYDLVSAE